LPDRSEATDKGNNVWGAAFERCESLLWKVIQMGRGILLWLLGIPLPIVILLVLFMR